MCVLDHHIVGEPEGLDSLDFLSIDLAVLSNVFTVLYLVNSNQAGKFCANVCALKDRYGISWHAHSEGGLRSSRGRTLLLGKKGGIINLAFVRSLSVTKISQQIADINQGVHLATSITQWIRCYSHYPYIGIRIILSPEAETSRFCDLGEWELIR
ncbi:hypothetical protein BDR07DRAFT_1463761 [Suillus spraguei]|nr:hypothetical protein BDR07DRAFT_1463761 [Suillus spraguei]